MSILEDLGRRDPPGVRPAQGDRLVATYVLQGDSSLEAAAVAVAVEESTGLQARHVPSGVASRVGGEVLGVEVADVCPPVLPAAPLRRRGVTAAEVGTVRIAWPPANATSIPALLTMVLGEANETGTFGVCRLVGLELPPPVLALFPGPGHGVAGCRAVTCVADRPLLGAIVKPSTGLSSSEHAAVAESLAAGGADFVKDDELLTDPAYCPLGERITRVPRLLVSVAERRGRPALYAPNVTGPVGGLRGAIGAVAEAGCGMVMLNVLAVGLDAFAHAVRDAEIPVFGHRVMSGALTRSAAVGLTPDVLCGLTRLCGADVVQVGSIQGKIFEEEEVVVRNADACAVEIPGVLPALPVTGGGQDAGTVDVTHAALGDRDHCHLLGSGVFDHPHGPAAGTADALEAWEAAAGRVG
ncbi:MAG: hypothetical protein IT198_02920 [Acidimicrobiia bacterium]|nr:hypothetical protein [Acidimicrobiia bacterium]